MNQDVASLTEKEKEALRLLLAGHDAKSSAAELDISVHTVNDRLRNARRKLSVSSSREAARILGDAEGATPQIAVPMQMGSASYPATAETADLTETAGQGPSRTLWLTGGMLTMSILIAIAAVAFVNVAEPVEDAAEPEVEEPAAQAAADPAESMEQIESFLAEVDDGDWQGSWEVAGAYFQSVTTPEEWTAAVEPLRSQLGAVQSREVMSVQVAETLPGAPDGDYEIVQFQTDYANGTGPLTETVIALRAGDDWQIMGYFIR